MKKSGVFILIFTFIVIAGFYSVNNKPKIKIIPNSVPIGISPTAAVSAKPSQKPTIKPLVNSTTTSTPTTVITSTPAPTTAPTSGKMTMDQVATHNTRNDCYLVINNNVYNVSSFIAEHPGGPGRIISNCGQEVTGIFASIHSNFAWDLLANYKIGQV